jgi:hypothetical protein
MDAIVSDLIILMKKSTDLLENMSPKDNGVNALANKNISNAAESPTFGAKETSDLSQNETKKVNKIASIFISKFFEQQDSRKKDTFEKTTLPKPKSSSLSSVERIENQIAPDKSSGGLLDKILGMLGLKSLFKNFKIKDILNLIGKGIGKVKNIFKRVLSSIGNFFKTSFEKLKNSKSWKLFKDLISEGADKIKRLATSAKDKIFNVLKSIGEFFKKTLSKIPGISKLIPGLSVDKASKEAAKETAKKTSKEAAKETAKKTSKEAAKKITTEAAKTTVPKQGGFLKSVGGFLKSAGTTVVSGAKAATGAVVSGAKVAGTAAVSGVKTAGRAVASGAKAAASFAIGPAKNAMSQAISGAVKTAGGVAKFLKVLKGVPLLGAIIESVSSYNDIKNLKEQYDAGKISIEELQQKAGKRGIQGVGGLIGTTAGGALGTALGSVVPIVGNLIGGLAGAIGGDKAGKFLGGVISDYVIPEKYTKSVGAFFTNTSPPVEEMQDFIIRGKNVYPFSSKDDVMGMKSGGAIENFLGASVNNNGVKDLAQIISNSNKYLQAIEYNTRLLNESNFKNKDNARSSMSPVILPMPATQSGPAQKVNFSDNRSGYASSVYSL